MTFYSNSNNLTIRTSSYHCVNLISFQIKSQVVLNFIFEYNLKVKYCTTICLVFILMGYMLIFPSSTVAQDYSTISNQIVYPGTRFYPLKRVWEKIVYQLSSSPTQRVIYYDKLITTRFAELQYVTNNKLLGEVEKSSQRFNYTVGEFVKSVQKTEDKHINFSSYIKRFEEYSNHLLSLRDLYPANSSYWLLIQQNIDTLKILSEQLDNDPTISK